LKQWQVQESLVLAPHPKMWRIYRNYIKRRPINLAKGVGLWKMIDNLEKELKQPIEPSLPVFDKL
jgi:hypothetical protein